MQLKVTKADGSVEEYLHTKVIGTIGNALAGSEQADMYVAEQLAEVVTYFLYHKQGLSSVSSGEIFSIVKTTLASTGYEEAAIALGQYHLERKLKRCRIEVVAVDIRQFSDVDVLCGVEEPGIRSRWDKSRIVNDLVEKHELLRQSARAIASMVEEKIFSMGFTVVPASLIKQLVVRDAAVVLRAQRQLQAV